jgi:hypothetical protein
MDIAALDLPVVKERVLSSGGARGAAGPDAAPWRQAGREEYLHLPGRWTFSDPNVGPWTDIDPFSNSRRFEIDGLTRGKDVWVRVRARNKNGFGPWSDPATIMVN